MTSIDQRPKPHPLSRDFVWTDADPDRPRRLSSGAIEAFNRLGFVKLEAIFRDDEIESVTREIDPLEARGEEWLRSRGGQVSISTADVITFTTHLVVRSPYLRRFTASRLFAGLCADLVGDDVRLYWDQAVYKKPGTESPFPWHQDNGYAFVEPQQYLTCWVALTDATEENGCPWVVPGLHRFGTLAHEYSDIGFVCLRDPTEAVPVPAAAGSIVVFSSLTPHSTGPNRTDEVRKAYIVQFAPDGAEVVRAGEDGGPTERVRADDASRQYEVVRGGRPVAS